MPLTVAPVEPVRRHQRGVGAEQNDRNQHGVCGQTTYKSGMSASTARCDDQPGAPIVGDSCHGRSRGRLIHGGRVRVPLGMGVSDSSPSRGPDPQPEDTYYPVGLGCDSCRGSRDSARMGELVIMRWIHPMMAAVKIRFMCRCNCALHVQMHALESCGHGGRRVRSSSRMVVRLIRTVCDRLL